MAELLFPGTSPSRAGNGAPVKPLASLPDAACGRPATGVEPRLSAASSAHKKPRLDAVAATNDGPIGADALGSVAIAAAIVFKKRSPA